MLSEAGNALGNTSTRGPHKVLPSAFSFMLGSVSALGEEIGILFSFFSANAQLLIASKERSEPNTLSVRY